MARFELLSDWPTNPYFIPKGTIIDLDPNDPAPQWNGHALPLPMPLNAKALDQAAYDQMVDWYVSHFWTMPDDFIHLLHYAKDVIPRTKGQVWWGPRKLGSQ